MSADIIPAGDRGSFFITDKQLSETEATAMAAFEVLLEEEAKRRGLQIATSRDILSSGMTIQWRPDRRARHAANE